MMLITKEIERRLLKSPIGSTDGQHIKPVIVKFFTPDSNWTWYAVEGEKRADGDWLFFGLVEGFETEWGYFALSEIQSAKGPLGLPIERDKFFDGMVADSETNQVMRASVVPTRS